MTATDYLPLFLAESREHLQELGLAIVRIETAPDDRATVEQVFRIAHSLKGMSATMGFGEIASLTHAMEDVFELLRQRSDGLPREAIDVLSACLDALESALEAIAEGGVERIESAALVERLRALTRERTPAQELALPLAEEEEPAPAPASRRAAGSVRVDAERLDELLHLMGELVIHRTAVEALAADAAVPGLEQAVQRLTRSSQALQATVTRVRMVPVETVFLRFPRLVRDLATRLGKQVELHLEGEDTELDRTVVDALGDPLVHLVRNALDHGLEDPAERIAAGKEPVGTLVLSARHAGGHVIVGVRDDGRGIDPDAVAAAALARGLIDADGVRAMDDARAAELLFAPGLSTAATTTDVSGRGVGMDAVRSGVRALGGEITLVSAPGAGTLAQIRLPLTLASVRALLVSAGGLPFAIPLDRVQRTLRLADHVVRTRPAHPSARMLVLADEALPLLDAGAILGHPVADEHAGFAVVLRGGERRVALAVEALVGQRELVTRRLPAVVSACAAAAGGAVLPDGAIALVVDCDALAPRDASPAPAPVPVLA